MLLLALSAHPPLSGAPKDKKPAGAATPEVSTLVERATVEMVLIEAYVTDGQGRPIAGLGPNDFVLSVDGKVRPISSIEFRNAESFEATPPAGPGPASPAPALAAATEKRIPRHFILFFEDSTSAPEGLNAARRATTRFLAESLVPDDQVGLAVFDHGLRLLHGFTTDRSALRQSVEASLADTKRISDFASEHDERASAMTTHSFIPEEDGGHRLTDALSYAADEAPRVRGVLKALQTLIDSLAPYPGYKAIVFMGDGLAENPAFDYLERFMNGTPPDGLISMATHYDLSAEIKQVSYAAAAAGVTLHSVQTSGVTSASLRASGRRQNAMETIALNTGGTKSTSNDLFKALNEAEVSSRAFYVLGYAPEGPPDGLYHTIQLRVRKSGARLRWRRGFTRFLPQEARERAIQAAYVLPDLYAEMGLEVTLIPGPADAAGRVADLVVHLPPGKALFVPRGSARTAHLEAGFVVIDASNHEVMRAARELQVASPIGGDQAPPGFDFYSRIRLPRTGQTITAVVSDMSTGGLGAARLTVPAADPPNRVVGLSIYSMAEKSLWVEIPTTPGKTVAPAEEVESNLGPALKTTFSVGEPVACGFRFETPAAGPEVRMVIRRDSRVVRSLPVADEDKSAAGIGVGAGTIKMKLALDDLPAGDYVLAVQASGETPGAPDLAAVPLRLRERPSDAERAAGG